MKQEVMRLGIIGLGEGRSLISAALKSPLWEIGNLCDLNERLCQERCHEFNLSHYTLDYQQMLNDPTIDVIGVYTPDRFHAEHIRMALNAGKHVICTKPLLIDLSQAEDIYRMSHDQNLHVFVGQSTRFFEPMIHQRADYEAKMLGDLISVEAHYHADHRWFLEKEMTAPDSFKWLYGCASHTADLIKWYMPDIEEVMGYGCLSSNGQKAGLIHDDSMHFVLKAKNGCIARVSGIYSSPTQPRDIASAMSCVLRGEHGASQADYPELRYGRSIKKHPTLPNSEVIEHYGDKEAYYFRFGGHTHHAGEYQNYLEYFARCIANGEVPKPDIREGIETVALMRAMDQSLSTGLPIKVKEMIPFAL